MRVWTAVLAVGTLVASARADAPTGGGRWVQARVPLVASGSGTRETRVWLPPSYDRPDARERRYPLVVLLHGWPGSQGNWPGQGRAGEMLGRLCGDGTIPEVIALFPDGQGSGTLGRSLWADSWDGHVRLETFLVHDLLAWADSAYRTRPDPAHRAVIGLSDGGTAAMNLVLRHPDVYGAAGAHSADLVVEKSWSTGSIFGPEPAAEQLRDAHSPLLEIAQRPPVHGVTLYFDCGVGDESIGDNRAFHARLDSLQIPHTYHEFPGTHEWGYWRTHLEQSLQALASRWR